MNTRRFGYSGQWIAILLSLLGIALPGAASASASTAPTVIHAVVLTYARSNAAGYGGDIAYGTPMKFEPMSVGVPNPDPVSCLGQRCFALGYAGAFQYPAISSDHGRTWRNGGHWFAGAWADAAAFASRMTVLTKTEAVAWFPMQNTGFYSTSTAGRRWYSVVWPGNVARVTGSSTGKEITVTVAESTGRGKRIAYGSRDGGLVWTLEH